MKRVTKMKLWMLLGSAALLGAAAVIVPVWLIGCDASHVRGLEFQSRALAIQNGDAAASWRPHGGTKTVNDAAYPAMFFKHYGVNPFIDTDDDRLSTFAMDVDTASYTLVRRYLTAGHLPPESAVRVEEFVNYLDYHYKTPDQKAFAIHIEGAASPFGGPKYKLIRIGLQGRRIDPKNRKPAVLTFVIDTSGSMGGSNRLGLVKRALALLVEQLRASDKVAIVEYGSTARIVMKSRPGSQRQQILDAINGLQTSGVTNAEAGIKLGYQLALEKQSEGAINRIILCSDGVANVGRTSAESILKQIADGLAKGVTLSSIGFGMGNYNDRLLEQLGDKGNGHYAYVDSIEEAGRIFVENLTGTLQVIARDAKIQVEFNPKTVSRFRLLGYENRRMRHQDFRDDKKDGGEVGSGHSVTAIYEVKLTGTVNGKLASVFLRYKDPDSDEVIELRQAISAAAAAQPFDRAPHAFRLAAIVAEFAEILRGSYWAKDSKLEDVLKLAGTLTRGADNDKYVVELVSLIRQAQKLRKAKADGAKDTPTAAARPDDPELGGD